MKMYVSIATASALLLALAACTNPAAPTPTQPNANATAEPASTTPNESASTEPTSTMPEPSGATGMTNTLNVKYECAEGGDLTVRYAGVADKATSTASFTLNGVDVQLPRKGDAWDNGTYILRGDNEISLAKAQVFVFQHADGAEKMLMKDCAAINATP